MSTYPFRRAYYRHLVVSTKGPNTSNSTFVSGGSTSWTNLSVGGQQPRWRDLVFQHVNAGTPFTGDLFSLEGNTSGRSRVVLKRIAAAAPYELTVYQASGDFLDAGDIGVLNTYSNSQLRSKVINQALSRFYNNAWSALRSMQGGVFLGEVREALNLIRNPAKAIRSSLNSYGSTARQRYHRAMRNNGRSDGRNSHRGSAALADTWLEYAFGWAPLISDVKSGAEAFARLSKHPYDFAKVVGFSEADELLSSDTSYSKTLDGSFHPYRIDKLKHVGKIQYRILGEVKCEVQHPLLMAQEVLGFSWNDFVPTVWELIPYSFLVDYFTNIGDCISAWSFPIQKLAWWNRTERAIASQAILATRTANFNPNTAWYKIESDTGSDLKVELSRKVITRSQSFIGFPTIAFEIPGSSLKWLNIAALGRLRLL